MIELPTQIKLSMIEKNFQFVKEQFNADIKKIEYWKGIKDYKIVFEKFRHVKKKHEFVSHLNNYIQMKNWPSLLNLVLQKSYKVAMEMTPKDFKYVNFLINNEQLIRVEVDYNNKKEANKLASLVILRLLAKDIYENCEKGMLFKADQFVSED